MILVLQKFPDHQHGYPEQFLAMVPKKHIVILLASLGIPHEPHGRCFRAGVLNDTDPFFH
jgi:hypothetical protein